MENFYPEESLIYSMAEKNKSEQKIYAIAYLN